MPQFAATTKHIKDGVKSFTIAQATKNIEGWEEALKDLDATGAKAIVRDLGSLKKHLHAEPIDGDAVRKLMVKLGKETVALAKTADGDKAGKIQSLGEALGEAADAA